MTDLQTELEKIALFCKKKEIEACERRESFKADFSGYSYWDAKACAFSQVWEHVVFNGRSVSAGTVSPRAYNEANEEWSQRIEKERN